MIVKCDQCQTRFKIPDEKVTEKWVKVRCTKCSHTFRVKKGPDGTAIIVGGPAPAPGGTVTQTAPAPPAPVSASTATVSENPFAQFAPPPAISGDDPFNKPTRVAPAPLPPAAAARPPFVGPTSPPAQPLQVTARAPYADLKPTATPGMSMSAVTVRAPTPGPDLEAGPTDPAASFGLVGTSTSPGMPGPASALLTATPAQAPMPADSGPPSGGYPLASSGPDRSLFDIPAPPPEPPPSSSEMGGFEAGLQELGAPPPPHPSRPGIVAPALRPAGRPEDAKGIEEAQPPGAARRVVGALMNLAVAAGLVVLLVAGGTVYLNEGKLDPSSLSPQRLRAQFLRGAQATVADVSNGLYETRSGRAIFFVRGVVQNKTSAPLNALVKAQLLDGTELVRAAEGMAGGTPTPEDVYLIASARDATRLLDRLLKEAKPIPPGGTAPFFLLFNFSYVQAPELARYRLSVTVQEGVLKPEATPPVARKVCTPGQATTMQDLMVCDLDTFEDGSADETQLRATLERLKSLYPTARFARPDDPNSWPAIVQRMLDTREYAEGCKSCHDTFGAEWRKSYRTWKLKPYAGATAAAPPEGTSP
jgi:predicted Zn finger-like uncharacterized protein